MRTNQLAAVTALFALALAFSGAVAAEELSMDDVNVVERAPAAAPGVATPASILDQIQGLLDDLYGKLGDRFTVQVQKDSAEDVQLRGVFDDYSGRLTPLWKAYQDSVKSEADRRRLQRDRQFQDSVASAYADYRQAFSVLQDDPTSVYRLALQKAKLPRFALRLDVKLWFDKTISLAGGADDVSSWGSDPMKFDDDDVKYVVGLLPSELLEDLNRSIQASFMYGYARQTASLDAGSDWGSRYLPGLDYGRLSYDYYCADERYYYERVYGSSWLAEHCARTFTPTQPKVDSAAGNVEQMQKAMVAVQAALAKAEAFQGQHPEITLNGKGQMYLKRDVSKDAANATMEAYKALAAEFKAAMDSYRIFLVEFRNNFPGAATGTLQKRIQEAFSTYRQDFVYGELKQLQPRYDALQSRAGQFRLDRRGGLLGASDKKLPGPGWWSQPREELYSAQRVQGLLPAELRNAVDARRRQAFDQGAYQARADYERTHPKPTTSTGNNDWGTNTNNNNDWGTNNGGSGNNNDWGTGNGGTGNNNDWGTGNGGFGTTGGDWGN